MTKLAVRFRITNISSQIIEGNVCLQRLSIVIKVEWL